MSDLHTVTDCYVGASQKTGELELRIVVDGQDLFFGTGKIDDRNPTVEESEEALAADPNWVKRVRVMDKLSRQGNPYKIAILSDIVRQKSISLGESK